MAVLSGPPRLQHVVPLSFSFPQILLQCHDSCNRLLWDFVEPQSSTSCYAPGSIHMQQLLRVCAVLAVHQAPLGCLNVHTFPHCCQVVYPGPGR